jgi:hypothetical protein
MLAGLSVNDTASKSKSKCFRFACGSNVRLRLAVSRSNAWNIGERLKVICTILFHSGLSITRSAMDGFFRGMDGAVEENTYFFGWTLANTSGSE